MVHCLRAFFILYIITIELIICVQEKIELSRFVAKTKVELDKNITPEEISPQLQRYSYNKKL